VDTGNDNDKPVYSALGQREALTQPGVRRAGEFSGESENGT
jgi:hypothetical protein